MNPLLAQFLTEADDLLVVLDEGMLRLEREPDDTDLINEVFRAAHTIKGSSGLFDFPELTRLVHAAEDLLDAVRSGRIALDHALSDDLFAVFDLVRTWLAAVGRTERLPAAAGAEGADLIVRLRAPLGGAPAPQTSPAGSVSALTAAPPWLMLLGEEWLQAAAAWLAMTDAPLRFARYQPDEACFFQGEDPLYLLRQIPGLDRLVPVQPPAWPPVEEYEEYASLLTFVLATRAGTGELNYLFRYVPEQVEIVELGADELRDLLADQTDVAHREVTDSTQADRERVDDAYTVLHAALHTLAGVAAATEALGVDDSSRDGAGRGGAGNAPPDVRVVSVVHVTRAAALALGREVELSPESSVHEVEIAVRFLLAEQAGSLGVVDASMPPSIANRPDGPDQRGGTDGRPGGDRPDRRADEPGARTLRVGHEKVDLLVELVGELHVAKNAMAFLSEAAEEEFGNRVLSRRIKDQYAVQHRLVEELQAAVMDIRMMPVTVVFARFTRLVRDLGRRLDKPVDLVTDGGETMADKDVIEALGDPLTHLVRNCVDHGLEPPAERLAAGKPEHGTVRLAAHSEGDTVVIEVADDGRGIDPEGMRRSAYAKGLINEQELASLSDADSVDLVFRPGFSTAAEVSDVSGRGVGMDAVRASAERLGGTVTLTSRPGAGTVARLRMPLSMAVTQVMVVSVAGQRFGVPIDAVVETVRIPADDVERMLRHDVIVLREQVIPLVDLTAALRMGDPPDAAAMRCVLVIRVGSHQVGLTVDAFHREVEVLLKPMEGMLADHPAFSGTALLGDGLVLLVLNPKEVLNLAAADA